MNKLYCYNNILYITIDNQIEKTALIEIDLTTFDYKVHYIEQGQLDCNIETHTRSNSYLYQNILYQIKGCEKGIILNLSNIFSDSTLASFFIDRYKEISFKNTPFIQNGSYWILNKKEEKELENVDKALKRILTDKIGISAYNYNDTIELTIGGHGQIKLSGGSGGMMMSPGMAPISGGSGGMMMSPGMAPTLHNYSSYTSTRSVYFKSMIDKNYYHIEGEVPQNVFEKIKDFLKDYEGKISAKTIFKMNDYYILGYYLTDQEKYILRKFVK